jgi:hypothetical protein
MKRYKIEDIDLMILHVKEKDAPVREISIEQAKFEFKNNIISRDALCWKIGMKEWVALDQLPEMHDRLLDSPKENKLNENWLNRQLDARRSFTSDAQPAVSQSTNDKSYRLKILAPIGLILMFIFTCILLAGSAISAVTRSEHNAPLLGVLCGMIVFRRLYRLECEKTALLKNGVSFTGYYFSSSLKSISKWFIYFIPAGIFAFLTGENASEYGTILGTLLGAIICTILLGLDVPIWVWRKKECIANKLFPEKNLAWALTGAISIPLAIYFAIFFMVPSFQRARERAEMAVRINKERAEAEEARKSELSSQDAVKPAWQPPEESFDAKKPQLSPPEKDLDVKPATSSTPALKRVFGKSRAYSLILPVDWEVRNDNPEHDFSAVQDGYFFDVIYKAKNSRSALEVSDISRKRLQKNGGSDFSKTYIKKVNNRDWITFSVVFLKPNKNKFKMTCMVHKNNGGVLIFLYGEFLPSPERSQAVFDSIIRSFNIE